ncbi:MAG: hypothetical protein WCF59_10005, partial [Desulfobaccales bacterium]
MKVSVQVHCLCRANLGVEFSVRLKYYLVNARRLAALGRELELGSYLLLGQGEELSAGREKSSLLADAL